MSSAFNDSASESKTEQALAECAALTRANDPRRALNAGRMIETAHLGQPRVLARVARMYSDLGMAEESARVLRGLQSAARPSGVAPALDSYNASDDLPSYGEDDDEPTKAKSIHELAHGLPGVGARPVRTGPNSTLAADPVTRAPATPAQSSGPPPLPERKSAPGPVTSVAPPPPVRSSPAAASGSVTASAPPPPQRNSAPPAAGSVTANAPPPPQRNSAPPAPAGSVTASAPPPPQRRTSAPPPPPQRMQTPGASQIPPHPPQRMHTPGASQIPPPPPGARTTTSVAPPQRHKTLMGNAPAPPLKPKPEPVAAAPNFPPPPGANASPAAGTAADGEWDFDEDDDEPTRAFAPGLVASSAQRAIRTPAPAAGTPSTRAAAASAAAPKSEADGWRDRVEAIRSKTVDSFDQLKKKSSDALRKISSRPPPPDTAPPGTAAKAVASRALATAEVAPGLPARTGFRSRRNIVLMAAVVAVAVIFFLHRQAKQHHESLENELTQATPLLWSSDLNEVKKIKSHLEHSFEVTTYQSLANAVAGGLGLADETLFPSLEPEAQVLALRQHAVLRLMDSKADRKELDTLLAAVQRLDVPAERVRFAKLLPALDAMPDDVSAAEKLDLALQKDPVALLLSGVILERVGKVDVARARYEAAAKERAEWHLPKVYATRLALLTQGTAGAKQQVEAIQEAARVDPNLGALSRALHALMWVVDVNRSRELPDVAKLDPSEVESLPPVLAQVPELVELIEAVLEEKDDIKQRLSHAIKHADGPIFLVQLAGIAASVNQGDLVDDAIDRVQEFAKGYAPAKALAARMQLAKGDFAAARQTAKAAGLDASGIDAVEAYENQDAKGLRAALEEMPEAERQKPEYLGIALSLGVLTGTDYPKANKLDSVLRSHSLWAEFIAMDAALDQGDLKRARDIIKTWPEEERTVLHDIRVARYERYKGRTRDAVQLSQKALDQASTSSRALIEHLSALLADDRLKEAQKLMSDPLYKDLLKPHEKWVDGLLLGKDKGWMAANIMVSYLTPPTQEEALSMRMLALRTMAVAGDPRAGVHLNRIGKKLPQNPDYLTAKSEY